MPNYHCQDQTCAATQDKLLSQNFTSFERCAELCTDFGSECSGFEVSMGDKEECILQGFNDAEDCADYKFCTKIRSKCY